METKHTKGEWKLNPLGNYENPRYYCLYVKPGDHTTVQHIAVIDTQGLDNKDELTPNAKLMCAAPAMLEVLFFLKEDYEQNELTNHPYYELITNAINKAV